MRLLYVLTSGTADPTSAALPLHRAVNGAVEVGDQPELLMAGDGTEFVVYLPAFEFVPRTVLRRPPTLTRVRQIRL